MQEHRRPLRRHQLQQQPDQRPLHLPQADPSRGRRRNTYTHQQLLLQQDRAVTNVDVAEPSPPMGTATRAECSRALLRLQHMHPPMLIALRGLVFR